MQGNEEINQKMNHHPIKSLIVLVILRKINLNLRENLRMKIFHLRRIPLKIRQKNLLQKNLTVN